MNLHEEIAVTAELTGTNLSESAAEIMTTELAAYPTGQVLEALKRCRRELKGRLTMAAVLERLDDGRPGAEEAWAMLPLDENSTAAWTAEMSQAFGVVLRMIDAGEMVAARMAFKETYQRLVQQARDAAQPVHWMVTLGHDPAGREGPLIAAVERGRITLKAASDLCPALPQIDAEVMLRIAGAHR